MTPQGPPRWLTADEQRVWRAYLDMTARLNAQLNREMLEADGISLSDFAVLARVSEHPDGAVRAGELGLTLGWEKSRLSHHVARMERRGLVERRSCDTDRRSAIVALTDCGRRTVEAAAPAHVAAVRRYLFDHLDDVQVGALGALAEAVVSGLEPVCPSDGCDGD